MSQISSFLSGMGLGDWVAFVTLIGIFIDFSPVKINPIAWIANRLGGSFNRSIDEKVDALRSEMQIEINKLKQETSDQLNVLKEDIEKIDRCQNDQIRKMNDNEIRRLRYEIIEAASFVTNGIKRPIDAYVHIMEVYADYHSLIEENHLTNGQINQEYAIIKDHYRENHSKGLTYF